MTKGDTMSSRVFEDAQPPSAAVDAGRGAADHVAARRRSGVKQGGGWPRGTRSARGGVEGALDRVIEATILPRLRLVNGLPAVAEPTLGDGARACASSRREAPQRLAAALAERAIRTDDRALRRRVDALVARGWSLSRLFDEALAPAAEELGVLWSRDLCDFTQVTFGVARLGAAARRAADAAATLRAPGGPRRRALLSPAPGEEHAFGLRLVAEAARAEGWEIDLIVDAGGEEAVARASSGLYDVAGFTAARLESAGALRALIAATRRAGAKAGRPLGVLVGGPIFRGRPELVVAVGADATALTAGQAAARMNDVRALVRRSA